MTVTDIIREHYDAIPDGAIPHLETFVAGVLVELDDVDEPAWEQADPLTAAKAWRWSEAELREAWGR